MEKETDTMIKSIPNEMNDEFEEYIEDDYEDEILEFETPKQTINRGFEKKCVDFSKKSSGYKRGLPSRKKSAPINKTRGKSPFAYSTGLQLHRNAEPDYPEDKPTKKLSWGVPWK